MAHDTFLLEPRPMARHGAHATTPAAARDMALLGPGLTSGAIALTLAESRHVRRLYGHVSEAEGPGGGFMQAGADRNALRHAQADGLRLLAWLARHVEPGQDPLRTLVDLACQAGWDVDPLEVDWVQGTWVPSDAEV